eukprot:gene40009-49464_t
MVTPPTVRTSVQLIQQSILNGDISLADGVWDQLPALTTVTFGVGMTTIPYISFYGCVSLKYVTLSSTIVTVGDISFKGCSSLLAISFPPRTCVDHRSR